MKIAKDDTMSHFGISEESPDTRNKWATPDMQLILDAQLHNLREELKSSKKVISICVYLGHFVFNFDNGKSKMDPSISSLMRPLTMSSLLFFVRVAAACPSW